MAKLLDMLFNIKVRQDNDSCLAILNGIVLMEAFQAVEEVGAVSNVLLPASGLPFAVLLG